MPKKIAIIGGGIAGLTAGIYAQKKGFDSTIYEQHTLPGGLCTGWDREGCHIDGCISWLTGSGENHALGKIWREIRALGPDVPIYQPDAFVTVEDEGAVVSLSRDLEKMRRQLLELSPDDRFEIDRLCDAIAASKNLALPLLPPELLNLLDRLHALNSARAMQQISRQFGESLAQYAASFRHPAIRRALMAVIPEGCSAYTLVVTLGNICSDNGGRPAGGSRAMALRMADYYRSLGGQLVLDQAVERILIRDGQAVGVELCQEPENTEVRADYVVPATDLHVTLSTLLEGRFPAAMIDDRDRDPVTYPTPTSVQAAFAVDARLDDIPTDLDVPTAPYTFEEQSRERLSIRHYAYEPGFAPPGKTVLTALLPADYAWWDELAQDEAAYEAEKKRLGDDLVQAIVSRFPQWTDKVRCLDIATPLTYERTTSAWRGAWMPYLQTPRAERLFLRGQIKKVKHLYMAGQWLMPPGGLPIAVLTGRWAIQRICKAEKMAWRW